MDPVPITSESFLFKSKLKPQIYTSKSLKKKSLGFDKNRLKGNAKGGHQLIKPVELDMPLEQPVNTQDLPQLLQRHTLYIDKSLWNQAQIKQIAEGMGATVKSVMDKSVTVIIVGPRGGERHTKLISQAFNNGYRCVSPTWITTCYNERSYYSPNNFPYDICHGKNTLAVSRIDANNTYEDDDNPFGIEPVDYDLIEATKPGNQLKLDGYITREACTASSSEENTVPSSYPIETQEETVEAEVDDQEEDEEEEMKREFIYNKSGSSSNSTIRTQETPEVAEARRELSSRRRKEFSERIEQMEREQMKQDRDSSMSSIEEENLKRKYMSEGTNYAGQQRLKVWYGEQQLPKTQPIRYVKKS